MPKLIPVAALAASRRSCSKPSAHRTIPPAISKAPKYGYTVVRSYPHDPKAFTQGLEYFGGVLYEGTGLKGRSAVRKVEIETGKVVQEEQLHPQYFGEGITISQGKLFQVTWQDRVGFVYDASTLKFIRNFSLLRRRLGPDARSRRADHERRHEHAPSSSSSRDFRSSAASR